MPAERLQQHPLLFTMNRTDRTSFLWRSQHHFVVIRKPEQQMCKASHWQQATIEVMRCSHYSIIACSCFIYIGVILCAHPVYGGLHIERNASREFATLGTSRCFIVFYVTLLDLPHTFLGKTDVLCHFHYWSTMNKSSSFLPQCFFKVHKNWKDFMKSCTNLGMYMNVLQSMWNCC